MMSTFGFSAQIDGDLIRVRLATAVDLKEPVFCFSLLTTPALVSGGTLIHTLGGYAEVQLPDLVAGQVHDIVLRYAVSRYRPVNRAWLPLGPYLRSNGKTYELPELPAGVFSNDNMHAEQFDGLRLVPPPSSWEPDGDTVEVSAFSGQSEVFEAVDRLSRRCGLGPFLAKTGYPVTVAMDGSMAAESYILKIAQDGANIRAADSAGAHYGAISLLVLRATHHGSLPCGSISDAPRFEWRGQHLDCARHFYRTDTILRLVDFMALFKLNRFHWHFSDDEAFRLEVDCAPEIWRKTAFRGEGEVIPGVFGGGIRSGGSYSKDDARAVVSHAQELHIEVLPEIEFPAHALALARARPDLRDPDDTGTEISVQGYPENVVNPALPAVWELFEDLALEVADLFPIGIVHLGCDELPEHTWEGSPAVSRMKSEHAIPTRDDIQAYAMQRLGRHLQQHGIRPAAWEEAARGKGGGIQNNALLFSWTGQGPGVAAARAGYDVIMTPAQHVYLDMAHTNDPDDWGAAWAGFIDLGKTIDWKVIPEPGIDNHIKGVQGTFWSEFTTIDSQIEPMLAPRLLGVATMAWSKEKAIDGDELRRLAYAFQPVFDAMQWTWHAP